jgi:hypothetical protein
MNTAYGEPAADKMPFNLRDRRNPILYSLQPEALEEDRRHVRAELSKDLTHALKLLFKDPRTIDALPKVERPRTAHDEAHELVRQEEYESALRSLQDGRGFAMVVQNVKRLFAEIERQSAEIAAHHGIHIEAGS